MVIRPALVSLALAVHTFQGPQCVEAKAIWPDVSINVVEMEESIGTSSQISLMQILTQLNASSNANALSLFPHQPHHMHKHHLRKDDPVTYMGKDDPVASTRPNHAAGAYTAVVALTLLFLGLHVCLYTFRHRMPRASSFSLLLQTIQYKEPIAVTANFAPLLGVLYLAADVHACERMDADETFQLGSWTQRAVWTGTAALAAQALLQLLAKQRLPVEGRFLMAGLRQLCMFLMYVSAAFIIGNVQTSYVPQWFWHAFGNHPPSLTSTSPAVFCALLLISSYLIVYLAFQICKVRDQFIGDGLAPPSYITEVLRMSITTLNVTPMCCVLFLAFRLRIWDFRTWHGYDTEPPRQVEIWIYVCTASGLVQTAMSIFVPMVHNPDRNGRHMLECIAAGVAWVSTTSFLVCAIVVACFLVDVAQVLGLEQQDRPVSWVRCVTALMVMYFIVHVILQGAIVVKWLTGFISRGTNRAVVAAKDAIVYAPMLAVLFLGARVRAARLGEDTYDGFWMPQSVKTAMFTATVAQMIFLLTAADNAAFGDEDEETEEDNLYKRSEKEVQEGWFRCALLIAPSIQVLALATIYGGTIVAAGGLLAIT